MSDINKFTTKEVLNKVLLDSSGNSVAANSHTSQEALNAVLDTSNNRLNVSLGGSNTISGDVTITGDLTVQGSGTNTYDEIVQGQLVVQTQALSSAPTPDTDADDFIIENNASGGMTIMTPDANPGRIAFASPSDNYGAVIMHQQSTGKLSINTEGGTGNISMATGSGVTALTIDSSQNVGIGTTATYGDLTVGGTGELIAGRASSGAGSFSMYEAGTTRFVIESLNGSGGVAFKVPSTEAMRIDSSGNVGIGTSSPASALDIEGTDNTSSKITLTNTATSPDNTWSIHANYNSQALAITGDSNEVMTLLDTGQVGIGDSSPDAILDVDNANSTGSTIVHITDSDAGAGNHTALQFNNTTGGGSVQAVAQFNTVGTDLKINAVADLVLQDTGANLGVGTASPSYTLDLSTSSNNMANFNSSNSTGGTLRFAQGGNNKFFLGMFSSISGSGTDYSPFLLAETGLGLSFGVNGTASKVMTLDSAGNLGIGLSNGDVWSYPGNALGLSGGSTANNYVAFNLGAYSTSTTGILGDINFTQFASDGTTGAERAIIRASNDGATDSIALRFFTTPTGGSVTERMRIDSSGNISIGTTSSYGLLTVSGGTPALYLEESDADAGDKLWNIAVAGETFAMNCRNDANSSGNSFFAVERTDSSIDSIKLKTGAGTDALVIDSSQNVGIGTSSPAHKIEAVGNALLNNSSGSSHHLYLGNTSYGINVIASSGDMHLTSNGSNRLTVKNGAGVEIASTLSLGGGINFPDSQVASSDANTLDDYEEGSFTPTFNNLTVGNATVTGKYTKIGNLVFVQGEIVWGSTTSATSSGTQISNLPFTIANDIEPFGNAYITDSGTASYFGKVQGTVNSTVLQFQEQNSGSSGNPVSAGNVTGSSPFTWTTNDVFKFEMTYRV